MPHRARGATSREKILKFEGAYHGLHDTALVSVKPKAEDYGDPDAPNSVPGGGGVPKAAVANVVVAAFNNLPSVERRFRENPGQIAAIILEPILMNVGLCMPQPGFLQGLRDIATKNGALLIYDEVKTGAKLAWGGASEYFGVKPDMICLAKSIGGGSAARRVWRKPRRDGSDLAAQSFSRRHVQHESRGHGGGSRHVPRSSFA